MCQYQSKSKSKKCPYPKLLNERGKNLPIDENGLCLFHSENVEWKKENIFEDTVIELISYLEKNPMSSGNNFSGFVFIEGQYADLFQNKDYKNRVKFTDCIFHNTLRFENSSFSGIDFSRTIFKKPVIFEKVKISNFYSTESDYDNGLRINNCGFKNLVHFQKCKFQNKAKTLGTSVYIGKCIFNNALDFSESIFRLKFFIYSTSLQETDFTETQFFNEFYIQKTIITQTVSFIRTEFLDPEKIAGYYSSVDLQQINLQETGKIIFRGKKPFYDQVKGEIYISLSDEPRGTILFENFNLNKFENSVKVKLFELEKIGIVQIGEGCRKYKVKTPNKTIKIGQHNQDVALEFAQSFTNYFIKYNGYNLGVEVVSKRRDAIDIFYFTDEDITLEELYERLSLTEREFWNYTYEDRQDRNLPIAESREILREIDNHVSKLGVLTKVGLRQKVNLWTDSDTESMTNAITFDKPSIDAPAINFVINKIYINPKVMKVSKIVAEKGGQVNIAEKIDKIESNQQTYNDTQGLEQQLTDGFSTVRSDIGKLGLISLAIKEQLGNLDKHFVTYIEQELEQRQLDLTAWNNVDTKISIAIEELKQKLPQSDAFIQQLKAYETIKFKDGTDNKGKFKVSIPLIPAFLKYEQELSFDFKQIWADVKAGKVFVKD